ncbi:MAG: RNA polymerase subunit sigma-24, partial [Brachybacterium sp.]|uniref:sigma factor-like helix-turn-helix DNA-binding protein n=1 Tax=Brachybacterium sp. TaxID=1891286 RepID=UPI00265790E1|nr:RNA polymerase subunit sigma-24 [Brachybacterium sp.]
EVFAAPYAEIAETLERSEAAVRQLVRRARAHVRERTPRHPVDESTHRALTEAFLEAVRGTAALEDMVSVLSPDVVLTTDGGGHAKAARRPVRGTDNVLRFAAGVLAKPEVVILSWQVADINGRPALVGHDGPRVDCVVWVEGETAGTETVVTRIDMIRNPGKLGAVRV